MSLWFPGSLALVIAPAHLEEAATPGVALIKDHVNRILNRRAGMKGPGRCRRVKGDVRGAVPVTHDRAEREGDTHPGEVTETAWVWAKDGR